MTLINPDGQSRRVEQQDVLPVLLMETRACVARCCHFDNHLPILGWAECIAKAAEKRGSVEAAFDWMRKRVMNPMLLDIAFEKAPPAMALFYGFKLEP